MHSWSEIVGGLQASIKALNNVSGFLTVLVAVFAGIAAFKQLRTWKQEVPGKIKYQVALDYRRSLFRLRNAISDLRYPIIRPNERKEFSDWKHTPIPEFGSSVEERNAFKAEVLINHLENQLKSKRELFHARWAEMMKRYREFGNHLLEAEVHNIRADRHCVDLDIFLGKVFDGFNLQFAEMYDEILAAKEAVQPENEKRSSPILKIADMERESLEEAGRLPPKEWTYERSNVTQIDELEAELLSQIERLYEPFKAYTLEQNKSEGLIQR